MLWTFCRCEQCSNYRRERRDFAGYQRVSFRG